MASEGLPVRVLEFLDAAGWHVTAEARAAVTATPARETLLERESGDSHVLVRPAPAGRVELVLTNPIDPSLPEGADGMAGDLAATHEAICRATLDVSGDDVRIVADGHLLAIASIDDETSVSTIERRVADLTAVAVETDRLHRTVRQIVRSWPADTDEPS